MENHDCEKITIQILIEKMRKYLDRDKQPYSRTYMKQKSVDHYIDQFRFREALGTETIVILQRKAEKIIDNFLKDLERESVEEEKLRIIQTVAQLIRDEIKSVKKVYVGENYPSVNSMTLSNAEAVIPSSLKRFLSCLTTNKGQSTNTVAIGHFIMQASFSRTLIMTFQIGLLVHLHDHFTSKYLIDTFYQLGFCKSSKEVRRYERSAVLTFKENDANITSTKKNSIHGH